MGHYNIIFPFAYMCVFTKQNKKEFPLCYKHCETFTNLKTVVFDAKLSLSQKKRETSWFIGTTECHSFRHHGNDWSDAFKGEKGICLARVDGFGIGTNMDTQ